MKNKYLGLICILYSVIILYVYFSGKLGNYLAPSMQLYIICAAIILIVIGIAILISKHNHYKFKISDLVLLLPLIMVILSGNGELSTSIATNRTNSFKTVKKVEKKVEKEEEKISIDTSNYDFTNVDYDIVDKAYVTLSDGITYNSKPDNLVGKTIRVRGFTLMKGSYIPKGHFSIGKYIVSCCTADAGFGGFIVKYDGEKKVKDNTWYEIEGVLEKGKDKLGNDIVMINAIDINKIDKKKEEVYVYPCYSYGDDGCDVLENYNLDY